MKIFIDDIRRIDWLYEILQQFDYGKQMLSCKQGEYFLFYYDYKEHKSEIELLFAEKAFTINERIYREQSKHGSEYVAYLQAPFESSTFIFYALLKFFITRYGRIEEAASEEALVKLDDLFLGYKAKDLEESRRKTLTTINGTFDVNSHISFNNALGSFFFLNTSPVAGLQMIADLMDTYCRTRLSKSFYGNVLSKIVRSVKNPNGGLIPEIDGAMRYMIVGEHALPNDENLDKAKGMLRSAVSVNDIYLQTGWYFNDIDSKWRKKISDESFRIKMDALTEIHVGDLSGLAYVPDSYKDKLQEFAQLLIKINSRTFSLIQAAAEGYSGKLSDFVEYSELFALYPDLAEMPAVLCSGSLMSMDTMYQADSPVSHIVLTSHSYSIEKIAYAAVHEIQHYVQNKEGFGGGGNTSLAKIIIAMGGETIRKFLLQMKAFGKKFGQLASLIKPEDFYNLIEKLRQVKAVTKKIKIGSQEQKYTEPEQGYQATLTELLKLTSSEISINNFSSDICNTLLGLYVSMDGSHGLIENFINTHIGADYKELLDIMAVQQDKNIQSTVNLFNKGWTDRDIYNLEFSTYQSLMGEMEARYSQETANVRKGLNEYFSLYSSETIPRSKVTVLNNSVVENAGVNVSAGIEKVEDKYIIHLPDDYSNSVNLIHELGHIVYDFASADNPELLADLDLSNMSKMMGYKNLEEYFCDSFVDYVLRCNIEPKLTEDLVENTEVKNFDRFDKYFNSILFNNFPAIDEAGLSERLLFINEIIEEKILEDA